MINLNKYKNTWTYNHKTLIVCLSLITVILWQNYSHMIPVFNNDVVVEVEKTITCNRDCLIKQWVQMRTDEIYIQSETSNRHTARLKALTELNEMLTTDYLLSSK